MVWKLGKHIIEGITITITQKMIQVSVKVCGSQRRYFEYITCQTALHCCHEKNRQLLVKENLLLCFFSINQFFAAIEEETTKKTQISCESFISLVKLFLENYSGQITTCNSRIYKTNQIFRHFMTFAMSKCGWLILHEMIVTNRH